METTKKISLYIGANNKTGVVDIATINDFVGRKFNSHTITLARGVWLGSVEDSVIVTILSTDGIDITELKTFIDNIRVALEQECILVEVSEVKTALV